MTGALVLVESRGGRPSAVTAQLVTAARSVCGGDVTLLVVDERPGDVARRLEVGKVAEVVQVTVPDGAFRPHVVLAGLHAATARRAPELVVLAHLSEGLATGPALAAVCGHGFASDVVGLHREASGLVANRGSFGGKLRAEVTFDGHETTTLLVRPGAFPGTSGPTPSTAVTLRIDLPSDGAIEHLGFDERAVVDPGLAGARLVVAIGRGVEDRAEVARIERLAERLGGAIAATGPVVDSGWVAASHQVGAAGASLTPDVYLTLGVSGAAEHLAGVGSGTMIIAVDRDPSAPIMQRADYGVVADLVEVVDALWSHLS